jgi:hypothetical protein
MRRAILGLVGILLLTTSANSEPFDNGYLQFCLNTVHSGASAIAMQYSQQQIERNLCMAQKYSALAVQDAQPAATRKACADATTVMTTALSKRAPSESPKSVGGDC